VTPAKQREALKFLQEHMFSDKTFQFSPELLRRLAVERWYHWGTSPGSSDFPLHDRVLGIQRLALSQLLSPTVLRRIQDNALKSQKDEQPLTVAEIFRGVTDGIWSELPNGTPKEDKWDVPSSVIRRNLQREHLKKLSDLAIGKKQSGGSFLFLLYDDFDSSGTAVPPDARSLARMHLREVAKRIDTTLGDKQAEVDDTTRAHLEDCKERISKVLSASMQVQD
jgi:hypothetical protein